MLFQTPSTVDATHVFDAIRESAEGYRTAVAAADTAGARKLADEIKVEFRRFGKAVRAADADTVEATSKRRAMRSLQGLSSELRTHQDEYAQSVLDGSAHLHIAVRWFVVLCDGDKAYDTLTALHRGRSAALGLKRSIGELPVTT